MTTRGWAISASERCNLRFVRAARNLTRKAGVECKLGAFPRERLNPNGGSVALGHPFGATGARILSQTVKELATRKPGQRAIVSICADGGQGSIVLLEAASIIPVHEMGH